MRDPSDIKATPSELAEDLRDQAREAVAELNADLPKSAAALGIKPIAVEALLEWEAADMIERMQGALQRIHDGTPDPKAEAAPFVEKRTVVQRPRGPRH